MNLRAGLRRRRWSVALAVVVVVSTVLQVRWAVLPQPEVIMRRAIADDAFYYLVLARNAPRPEFTEGIRTTGFHPLYWVVLAPVVRLFDGFDAVRATLLLVIALHQVSGLLLYRALRLRYRSAVSFTAAALWLLLPATRTIVVMGVESALLACCLALLLHALLLPGPVGARRAVAIGALAGLCYLARTDSLFVTVPLCIAWAWPALRSRGRVAIDVVVGGAVGALAVALPWIAYAAVQGGLHASDAFRAERRGSTIALFLETEKRALAEIFLLNGAGDLRHTGGGAPANLVLIVAVSAVVWLLWRSRDRIGLAGVAGPVLLFLAYGLLEGWMRDWYLVYAFFAICAFLVPPVADRTPPQVGRVVLPVVLILAAAVHPHVLNPQEADKYRAAAEAAALLPPDARVGAFNAGIYQYFLPQDVVNLDGVVNPDVLAAKKAGRICDYLAADGITHLVDTTYDLDQARLDPRLRFTSRVDLSARYDPSGRTVVQPQWLVAVDLERCGRPG